ncbi:hypothetical protein FRC09_013829 [Ceratobasidium sp. 395]|nr:hypothetical protein FRC09_013829 [Ceratobasidium sp. 395]
MVLLEPSLLCLDLIHGFKKELYSPTNKPSAVYCKSWVEGSAWESRDGIVLSDHSSSDETDRPNSCTSGEYESDDEDDKSQLDSHLDASEAEVDNLIQTVEDTEMLDGEEPTNKSDQDTEMSDGEDSKANESMEEGEIRPAQVTSLPRSISYTDLTLHAPHTPPNRLNNSGSRTPATFPFSHVRSTSLAISRYRSPSVRYLPYERVVRPGDWHGVRYGDITYMGLPSYLSVLQQIGSQWSFSRTEPLSTCQNRNVGDIHFIPGEVRGGPSDAGLAGTHRAILQFDHPSD